MRSTCLALSLLPSVAAAQDLEWGPWHLVGPFGPIEEELPLDEEFWPEKKLRDLRLDADGPDLARRADGRDDRDVGWLRLGEPDAPAVLDFGEIDLREELRGTTSGMAWSSDAAAYLYRSVRAAEPTELTLFAGAYVAARVWLDGEPLADLHSDGFRFRTSDQSIRLELEPGLHHLLVKVVSPGRADLNFRMQEIVAPDHAAVSDAVAIGVRYLLEEQYGDGSWIGWAQERRHTALVVEALLAAGLDESHPAVHGGLERLAEDGLDSSELWEHLLRALAPRDSPRRRLLEPIVARLVEEQQRDGLWSDANLTRSASIVATLLAAREAGWDVPDEVFERLEKGLSRLPAQKVRGARGTPVPAGYGRAKGFEVDAHNTAQVLSCAAAVERVLGDGLSTSRAKKLDGVVQSSLAWLETVAGWDRDPTSDHPYSGHLDHLLRIQNALRALERDTYAGIDWRTLVTSLLLEHRARNGTWSYHYGEQELAHTALAVLLLADHLQDASVPHLHRKGKEALAGLTLAADFGDPMRVWIDRTPGATETLELDVRRAVLVATPVHGGGTETLAEWELSAGVEELLDRETTLTLAHRGVWELELRLSAEDDAGEASEHVVGPLRVVRTGPIAELAAAREDSPNTTPARVRWGHFTASSTADEEKQGPENLGDRSLRDVWLCAPDDDAPTITVRPGVGTWVRELVFTHGRPQVTDVGRALAARVRVRVGGALEFELDLPADPCAVARCDLGERVRFEEIEITILESRNRVLGEDGVGFAEIEFLDREE